jgi:hypothetical protein
MWEVQMDMDKKLMGWGGSYKKYLTNDGIITPSKILIKTSPFPSDPPK